MGKRVLEGFSVDLIVFYMLVSWLQGCKHLSKSTLMNLQTQTFIAKLGQESRPFCSSGLDEMSCSQCTVNFSTTWPSGTGGPETVCGLQGWATYLVILPVAGV